MRKTDKKTSKYHEKVDGCKRPPRILQHPANLLCIKSWYNWKVARLFFDSEQMYKCWIYLGVFFYQDHQIKLSYFFLSTDFAFSRIAYSQTFYSLKCYEFIYRIKFSRNNSLLAIMVQNHTSLFEIPADEHFWL